MDDLYRTIKSMLDKMRDDRVDEIPIDFHTLSRVYQIICLMKQIRAIATWGDKGYE